jgi:hypothetical protein
MNRGLPQHIILAAITKNNSVIVNNRIVVLPMFAPGNTAYLEYVDEIGVKTDLKSEVNSRQVKVFEREAIEQNVGRE